jgi:hypothetical protein
MTGWLLLLFRYRRLAPCRIDPIKDQAPKLVLPDLFSQIGGSRGRCHA